MENEHGGADQSRPQSDAEPGAKPLTFAEKVEKSSQVASVEYDQAARQLKVVFKNTAALYTYHGFEPERWAELQAADSVGSYLYKNVTGKRGKGADEPLPYQFTKTPLPLPEAPPAAL